MAATDGLLQLLMPLFAGTGTTTKSGGTTTDTGTTTSGSSATSIDALTKVMQDAMSNGADTSKLTNLVNNLFTQAGENFLPSLGEANSSGLYNTTTLGLLSDKSRGAAVNQAAQSILNYQTSQQQIANTSAAQLAQATKTTNTSSSSTTPAVKTGTAPIVNPLITGAGAAALLGKTALSNSGAIKDAYNSIFGSKPAALPGTSDPLVQGGDPTSDWADVTSTPNVASGDLGSVLNSAGTGYITPPAYVPPPTADATLSNVAGPAGTSDFTPDSLLDGYTGSGSDAFPASTLVDAVGAGASQTAADVASGATDATSIPDVGAASDILDGTSTPSLWTDVPAEATDAAASSAGDFVDQIFSWFG